MVPAIPAEKAILQIRTLLCAVYYHLFECGTIIVCTRHCSINIRVYNYYFVFVCIIATYAKLSFNRLLGLTVAAVASIDYGSFHIALLVEICFVV